MNQTKGDSHVDPQLDALESRVFNLTLALLAGGFVVVGGLLTIIAALVTLR